MVSAQLNMAERRLNLFLRSGLMQLNMAKARVNPSFGGYDEEFVNAVEDDLQCAICRLALKSPVQTTCGHRFCRDCLDEHFKRYSILPYVRFVVI